MSNLQPSWMILAQNAPFIYSYLVLKLGLKMSQLINHFVKVPQSLPLNLLISPRPSISRLSRPRVFCLCHLPSVKVAMPGACLRDSTALGALGLLVEGRAAAAAGPLLVLLRGWLPTGAPIGLIAARGIGCAAELAFCDSFVLAFRAACCTPSGGMLVAGAHRASSGASSVSRPSGIPTKATLRPLLPSIFFESERCGALGSSAALVVAHSPGALDRLSTPLAGARATTLHAAPTP